MYNQYRNNVLGSLLGLDNNVIEQVLLAMDIAAKDYEFKKKETAIVPSDVVIPQAVYDFLACKTQEGLASGTLQNYKRILISLFCNIKKPLEEVKPNDIRVYLMVYQRTRGCKNQSINKLIDCFNSFFGWAASDGYINASPMLNIRRMKEQVVPRQALTDIELEEIRKCCKTKRDKAIVEMLYSTGCRVSELINLKKSDIDWNTKEVRILGKGNKKRISYINAKAYVALQDYFENDNRDGNYVIVGMRKPHDRVSRATIEAVIKELAKEIMKSTGRSISPHIIRHTTATDAAKRGMPIEEISQLLGHSNVGTTMIYAHIASDAVKNNHNRYIV